MNKLKISKYILLPFAALMLTSCLDKDIEVPSTQILATVYYDTDEQVNMAVTAAYDPMGWVWQNLRWGASLKTYGNFASDDAYTGGNDEFDQPTYQACDTYTVSPSDPGFNLEAMWTAYFKGSLRAGLILENVAGANEVQKQAIAQAKFLKGFYHFYLARMFGGLPIVEGVPLPDGLVARSTYEETLAYCASVLEEAIASGDLPQRNGTADPASGFATEASAQALLGKVRLYQKDYAGVIDVLEKVAANGSYQLEDDYWRVFKPTNKHGIESIFEINFSSNVGAGNEGNADIYLMGPRGGVGFNDTITSGWGFNQPTQSLVDAYNEQNDNVRLHGTVFFSDSLQAWYNVYLGNDTEIIWQSPRDGYWDRKHYPDPSINPSLAHSRMVNNDIILRLADVYLMLAEAYVRNGDGAKAAEYVNKLRVRAKLPSFGSVTLEQVKKERRLELALEAERYFDLVRWTGDADQIDADHVLGPLGYANGTPGTNTKGLFPIPQVEINSTYGDNKLIQNEGY